MYDVILLGATFAAAGIAQSYKEKCLILDSKPYAGYEFLSALHFGSDYDKPLKTEEGRLLFETFTKRQALEEDRICLFNCAAPFYQLLEGIPVLLNMQILSVKREEEGFTCIAHGVSGYRTLRAKKVIDTRCTPAMCSKKTYNFLVDGKGEVTLPEGVKQEKWGHVCHYVLRCPVPVDADYSDGRKAALNVLKTMPEGERLLLLADEFDCTVRGTYPKVEDGITYLPSKAYPNPILAYEAGVCFAKGGELS